LQPTASWKRFVSLSIYKTEALRKECWKDFVGLQIEQLCTNIQFDACLDEKLLVQAKSHAKFEQGGMVCDMGTVVVRCAVNNKFDNSLSFTRHFLCAFQDGLKQSFPKFWH